MNNNTSDPNNNGVTRTLSGWLADLSLDQVPESARERARLVTLDGIGCALVGAHLPWSRTAVEAVLPLEGIGDCPLIGWGKSTTAPAAALLNGTFIQGFELDDFHPYAPLHSASLVLPSLLACARNQTAVSGDRFLLAAIAGYEVGPRVGLALHGAQMLSRGWHSGSVFGTHASAAAAGVLLGLDSERFEDALGLAATQSCGLMAAQYEAMSKRMHHGFSARNGLYAAELASRGFTGIKRVFEREYGGFLSTFGEGHDPDASLITAGLGENWEVERIVIKQHAAMGGLHSALDALAALRQKQAFDAADVASIDVYFSHAVYHHGWWPLERPITPIAAQMNIAYALSVALLDGEAMVAQFSPTRIADEDVWALIPKVQAHHDPAFDAAHNRGRCRLRISFHNGQSITFEQPAPNSVIEPPQREAVIEKFRHLTAGVIPAERRDRIETLVLDIERQADVSELITLLAEPVSSPFD